MDLAKGLTTQQLHKVAEALRYIELTAGNTVYRCGEEAVAAYFVLSGRLQWQGTWYDGETTLSSIGRRLLCCLLWNGFLTITAKSSSLHVQRKTHCYTNDQL
ncbi:uncharacterized protein IUM83_00628 [Phytophthora cinnamomi]|uniref:uncharacterized protein n=1 Tax=Phytophthora cinnamomi TaxID=4785 RepID=UPI003559BCF8|nr:hypothetical protein IUM83_00628 [Phytophthora cinnamomi]